MPFEATPEQIGPIVIIAGIIIVLPLIGFLVHRIYPGYGPGKSFGRGLLALLATALLVTFFVANRESWTGGDEEAMFIYAGFLVIAGFLGVAWLGDLADIWRSESGKPRLSTFIVGCIVLLILGNFAFQLMHPAYWVLAGLFLIFGKLLWVQIQQRMDTPRTSIPFESQPGDPERERVLAMLEKGAITPDEASELLSALRTTEPVLPLPDQPNRLFIAAGLLFVGFFLPWVQVRGSFNADWFIGKFTFEGSVNGAGMVSAMGWIILLLGMTVALLPAFAPHFAPALRRKWSLGFLAGGAFLLLLIASFSFPHLGFGFFLVLGSFGLMFWHYLPPLPVRQTRTVPSGNQAPDFQ